MSRINVVTDDNATDAQRELLASIRSQLGGIPNFLRVFANSPTALKGFLGLHTLANEGLLEAKDRERIALALAQQNGCQYCLSAHTAIGRKAGLSSGDIDAARAGSGASDRAQALVSFATALSEHTGDVTSAELKTVRDAGFSDGQIVEIIAHVGLNLLTNVLAKASRVEIDFPRVALDRAA